MASLTSSALSIANEAAPLNTLTSLRRRNLSTVVKIRFLFCQLGSPSQKYSQETFFKPFGSSPEIKWNKTNETNNNQTLLLHILK
jgi:hypothetical protein